MIRKLVLQNFKCFEEQAITLAPLTLLTGLNGAGKSTVIQSFLLLKQSFLDGTLDNIGLSLNGDLVYIGTGQDALYQNAKTETIGIELHTDAHIAKWECIYEKDSNILSYARQGPDRAVAQEVSLLTSPVQYLSANRSGPRTAFPVDSQMLQHKQLGALGEYTVQYLAKFGNDPIPSQKMAHPDATSNSLLHQANSWLGTISPGSRISVAEHYDMDAVTLRYQFADGRELSNTFRSSNVGYGLTYVLPVIVSLLSSTAGSIVLLENPEAHLHPQGQSSMGRLMALASDSGAQIICETHSDHILNGVRLSVHQGIIQPDNVAIRFFKRELSSEKTIHTVSDIAVDRTGRLTSWPEGFFDEWDKSLDALITPAVHGGQDGINL